MPYSIPSPSSSPVSSPSVSRPSLHRRSRSCSASFSDDKGPGAFVSLGSLPKRKPLAKNSVFHLKDDYLVDDKASNASPPSPKNPSLFISLPQGEGTIPFPSSSSSLLSPLSPFSSPKIPLAPSPPPDFKSSIPRSSSSPIILSNGKPLKPSLKSASASPQISHVAHLRAQSAPSTPSVHKNVHFAEDGKDLETVRVYNRSGKPSNLYNGGEDTETETEADNTSYFNFPSIPQSPPDRLPIIDSSATSPIPSPSPNPYANIHIESLTLPKSRPAALYGSILVRNIAFEKRVALRFTLDNWQTTSEVLCKHVVSLPALPPPFPRRRTVGDAVGLLAANDGSSPLEPTWDRFSFCVHLEYYEHKLHEQTVFLVGRFTCPVGEWWDNNDGKNYRIFFKRPAISPMPSPDTAPSVPCSQQNSFTAPSTMKTTPATPMAVLQTNVLPFPVFSPRTSPTTTTPTTSSDGAPVTTASSKSADTPQSPSSKPETVTFPRSPHSSGLGLRRGFGDSVKLSSQSGRVSLTNYAAPSPGTPRAHMQTPTPPRSRSGSLECDDSSVGNSKSDKSTTARTSPSWLRDGSPLFTSPHSSPPRVSSPPLATSSLSTPAALARFKPSSMPQDPPSANNLQPPDPRAALVKQWCFAQSSPPTPGIFDGSIVDTDVTCTTEDLRRLASSSNVTKQDSMKDAPSPTSENSYAWWINGGRVDYTKSGNSNGWFTWAGDTHTKVARGTSIGVGG